MNTTTIVLYLLIWAVYLPGLYLFFRRKAVLRYPVISFTFIGMIVFNVTGSIFVLSEKKILPVTYNAASVSMQYACILALQAVIFYIVVLPYIRLRKETSFVPTTNNYDKYVLLIGVGVICLTILLYYRETGTFLIYYMLSGEMNSTNAFSYRIKYVYGLKNWPFFNIGLNVLPFFIAQYSLVRAIYMHRTDIIFYIAIIISMLAPLTLGSKGGLIGFLPVLFIAYMLCQKRKPLYLMSKNAVTLALTVFSVAIAAMATHYVAYKDSENIFNMLRYTLYRVLIAYTESIAGAISYVANNGLLGMSMFPTMRGLLSHEQVNVSLLMHEYISGYQGGTNVPFVGEAYLLGGWSGVVVGCTIVFVSIIVIQEIAVRLRPGLSSVAIQAFYSYLSFMLPAIGMFSTLYTFMYPSVLAFILLAALLVNSVHKRRG